MCGAGRMCKGVVRIDLSFHNLLCHDRVYRTPMSSRDQTFLKSVLKWGLFVGCVLYLVVLLCVVISNFSLFNPNWPFGLFASFTPTLLFALPFVLVIAVKLSRRLAGLITLIAVLAFGRFVTFDHSIKPSGGSCVDAICTTIVMTNLRQEKSAVQALADLLDGGFDILVLTEVPRGLTKVDLENQFGGTMLQPDGGNPSLASPLAVISRLPQERYSTTRTLLDQGERYPRGILDVRPAETRSTRPQILGLHPVWPKTASRMQGRNDYLNAVAQMRVGENFVMIGDFNLTPWEPFFSTLPGRRAGNPRWIRTWNANDPVQRITIDHALIGSALELVETEVMQDVGSDHYPIRVVVKAKG